VRVAGTRVYDLGRRCDMLRVLEDASDEEAVLDGG
jgi:hypothetical protein